MGRQDAVHCDPLSISHRSVIMVAPQDSLAALEAKRLELEQSHQELQRSIYHWRLWEAEYDGFKADVAALDEGCLPQDIWRAGRDYGGTVVTEEEIKSLTGEKQGLSRSRAQVESAVQRRIDYVQENLKTLERRDAALLEQLDRLQEQTQEQSEEVRNDDPPSEGLPITDIIEHLDEDGNIISTSTKTPEQDAPQILAALKEAGFDKVLQEGLERRRKAQDGQRDGVPKNAAAEAATAQQRPVTADTAAQATGASTLASQVGADAHGDQHPSKASESQPDTKSDLSQQTEQDNANGSEHAPCALSEASAPSEQPQLDLQIAHGGDEEASDSVTSSPQSPQSVDRSTDSADTAMTDKDIDMPVIDESPEEAALRREILRYSMEEVGAVVAELELDEDAEEVSVDEEYDQDYDWDEEEGSEDELGRSKRSLITDEYRAQMEELERRLKEEGLYNAGPNPYLDSTATADSSPLQVVARVDGSEVEHGTPVSRIIEPAKPALKSAKADDKGKSKKKSVAFADALDIAPEPESGSKPESPKILPATADAIKEEVMERLPQAPASQSQAPPPPTPTKRVSRFKSARKAGNTIAPAQAMSQLATGSSSDTNYQHGQSQAPMTSDRAANSEEISAEQPLVRDTLVERETPRVVPAPPDPDDFDETLHRQEVVHEFYRARNRKIAQEGGFTTESFEDRQFVPLDEDADGKPIRKQSRFMAARLNRS
ncbi:hypothetical protein KEM52_005021 [Ascosphaera acerosa]|nr:hypothetical protein KEM52_005021 [Ascosphaera acerosa]